MIQTAQLAGFFAAHGIWSVSDGETLIPMVGYEDAAGDRGMDRFVADDLAAGARSAQEALQTNRYAAARAVLVADGYLHLDTGRTDALIVEAVEYGPAERSLKLAVPYRPRASQPGFAVHRPKFLEVTGVEQEQLPELAEAFFAGVDAHEEAAAVWAAHLDESV